MVCIYSRDFNQTVWACEVFLNTFLVFPWVPPVFNLLVRDFFRRSSGAYLSGYYVCACGLTLPVGCLPQNRLCLCEESFMPMCAAQTCFSRILITILVSFVFQPVSRFYIVERCDATSLEYCLHICCGFAYCACHFHTCELYYGSHRTSYTYCV